MYPRRTITYELRWFTPKSEIDLCGHAALASAYVVSYFVNKGIQRTTAEYLSYIILN